MTRSCDTMDQKIHKPREEFQFLESEKGVTIISVLYIALYCVHEKGRRTKRIKRINGFMSKVPVVLNSKGIRETRNTRVKHGILYVFALDIVSCIVTKEKDNRLRESREKERLPT